MGIILRGRQGAKAKVNSITLIAGYWEILEIDQVTKRPLKRIWHPQVMKNGKGEVIVISHQIPIEDQFNSGAKERYYLDKGFLYTEDAEEKLKNIDLEKEFELQNPQEMQDLREYYAEQAKNKELKEVKNSSQEDDGNEVLKPKRGRPVTKES